MRKGLKTVSRVHDLRGTSVANPAIKISGQWLREHCKIGDKYSVKAKGKKLIITII